MLNAILSGCGGAMGRVVSERAQENGIQIVAGIDRTPTSALPYPVFASFDLCDVIPDIIIDFSNPSITPAMLAFAQKNKIPVIIATTGFTEPEISKINAASQIIPIFFTFNMSLGVNLLTELARRAASILGESFDIEIVEKHHNKKVDAPSGTAIMIANAVSEATSYSPSFVYDRQSSKNKREKNEIGMHSIRGGTIVGEHEIIFAGTDEIFTISHSARSKEVFATGAYKAVHFMMGKTAGLYNMKDLL